MREFGIGSVLNISSKGTHDSCSFASPPSTLIFLQLEQMSRILRLLMRSNAFCKSEILAVNFFPKRKIIDKPMIAKKMCS